MTTNTTPKELVNEAIDKLLELHIKELIEYYGSTICTEDIMALAVVDNIQVTISASSTGKLYLTFTLAIHMSDITVAAELTNKSLAGYTLIATQLELDRYKKVAGRGYRK